MGLAATSGDVLVSLAAMGGDDFASRLKAILEAKAGAEAAFNALSLGTDAAKAWEAANAAQADVNKRLANLDLELQQKREEAQAGIDAIRADASAALAAARTEAAAILDQARRDAAAITEDVSNLQASLNAQHDAAAAAQADAAAQVAQAATDSANAVAMMQEAKAAKERAETLVANLHAVLQHFG